MAITISSWSTAKLRQNATAQMTWQLKIVRPAVIAATDLVTGRVTIDPPNAVIYEGVGRIWQTSSGGAIQYEDVNFLGNIVNISIPWDAAVPNVDDVCEVITAPYDTDLQDVAYRINGVTGGGQVDHQAAVGSDSPGEP